MNNFRREAINQLAISRRVQKFNLTDKQYQIITAIFLLGETDNETLAAKVSMLKSNLIPSFGIMRRLIEKEFVSFETAENRFEPRSPQKCRKLFRLTKNGETALKIILGLTE